MAELLDGLTSRLSADSFEPGRAAEVVNDVQYGKYEAFGSPEKLYD